MDNNKALATITSPEFLERLSPKALTHELRNIRTAKDVLTLVSTDKDNYPSLARLRAVNGETKIEAIIKLHIINLCKNVNLKRPLNVGQIDNIAMEIVNEFYALNMADIHVVFRKALLGEFGEFYEGLDMPKIMSWFREYFDNRCDTAAQISINESAEHKGRRGDPRESARWTAYFNKLEREREK